MNEEQYCTRANVGTYNDKFADGSKSYGGYATYSRVPGHFAIPIPDGLSSAEVAPMLCGGATIWSPLTMNGCGKGKTVGILGVGGIGHFGILFAKALGADAVVAISRTSSKKDDAMKLGADKFIATKEDENWAEKNSDTLDLIVSTVSSADMALSDYLTLLKVHGQFIQVGAPEDSLPAFNAFALIAKGAKLGGSSIGSPLQIRQMLEFVAEKNIHPYIEERPMSQANQTSLDMEQGKARYRYVLL